jgi:hypothetical protein
MRNFTREDVSVLQGCPGVWGHPMGQELSWPYKVVPRPIVSVFLQKNSQNNTHLFKKEKFASVTYHFTATYKFYGWDNFVWLGQLLSVGCLYPSGPRTSSKVKEWMFH